MAEEQQDKIGKIEIHTGEQNAIAKTEMPLRLLVLGDFVSNASEVQDWASSSRLINVTPGNFNSVMQQLEPRLSLDVPNRLGDSPKELTVELTFTDMKAFRPEGIVQQVDELAGLMEIRRLISQFKDRKITLQEFDEQIQQTGVDPAWIERFHQTLSASHVPAEPEPRTAPPENVEKPVPDDKSSSKGDELDALLDMVDFGDEQDASERASYRKSEEAQQVVDKLSFALQERDQ